MNLRQTLLLFLILIVFTYFILKVKDTETTEKDCPSLVVAQKKKKTAPAKQAHVPVTSNVEVPATDVEMRETSAGTSSVVAPQFAPSTMTSTQNARFLVTCVECRKPRVLYSLHKLTERQKVSLVVSVSEYDYTCGAPVLPPGNILSSKVMVRASLTCAMPVEIPYYGSELGTSVPSVQLRKQKLIRN